MLRPYTPPPTRLSPTPQDGNGSTQTAGRRRRANKRGSDRRAKERTHAMGVRTKDRLVDNVRRCWLGKSVTCYAPTNLYRYGYQRITSLAAGRNPRVGISKKKRDRSGRFCRVFNNNHQELLTIYLGGFTDRIHRKTEADIARRSIFV